MHIDRRKAGAQKEIQIARSFDVEQEYKKIVLAHGNLKTAYSALRDIEYSILERRYDPSIAVRFIEQAEKLISEVKQMILKGNKCKKK